MLLSIAEPRPLVFEGPVIPLESASDEGRQATCGTAGLFLSLTASGDDLTKRDELIWTGRAEIEERDKGWIAQLRGKLNEVILRPFHLRECRYLVLTLLVPQAKDV